MNNETIDTEARVPASNGKNTPNNNLQEEDIPEGYLTVSIP